MDNYIFQKYHQRENVITANFLFFLKNVRRLSEKTYNDFIYKIMNIDNETIDFDNNELTVKFKNQAGKTGEKGIVDASITMPTMKILVEAKGNGAVFSKEQFKRHIAHFDNEDFQLYLTLDTKDMLEKDKLIIKELMISEHKDSVKHTHLRYQDIVNIIKTLSEENQNPDLKLLINEYENYLREERLIDDFDYIMKMVLAGSSLEQNINHSFYFHPSNKKGYSFKSVKYLGLYNQKAIRAIGEVDKVVKREVNDGDVKYEVVYPEKSGLSKEEKSNLELKIKESIAQNGWNVITEESHYFYLIKERFHETKFVKESSGGAMGVKYFNLKDILDIKNDVLPEIKDIAELLKEQKWD